MRSGASMLSTCRCVPSVTPFQKPSVVIGDTIPENIPRSPTSRSTTAWRLHGRQVWPGRLPQPDDIQRMAGEHASSTANGGRRDGAEVDGLVSAAEAVKRRCRSVLGPCITVGSRCGRTNGRR